MAERITAPINYPVIAGGKIVKGGSVVFGEENVKPDPDNISTLKPVYLDSLLSAQADNPQGLSSDGVFDQSDTGILFGADGDKYSILILDQRGVELSYIASYDLSDTSAAASAQQSALEAQTAEAGAVAAQSAAESAQSSAEAVLNEFQNQYWGAYSSEPSFSPVGDPPTDGDLYFNTTSSILLVYSSTESAWKKSTSAVNGVRSEGSFTNVAGQDTFAFNYDPNYVDVFYNGQRLQKVVDFDASSGTQVVLNSPVTDADDSVTIIAFNNVDFADLGTAASRDAQTSATDTTEGRLMAVGAFGSGNNQNQYIGGSENADTYNTTGAYYANFSNGPTTSTAFLVVDGSSGDRVRQTWYDSVSSRIETRYRDGSTWSAWQPVYTGANYQPETSLGLGVPQRLINISGDTILDQGVVSGALLQSFRSDSTGNRTPSATASGLWKNVSLGWVTDLTDGLFVRIQ